MRFRALLLAVCCVSLASCSNASESNTSANLSSCASGTGKTSLTVFAASSLQNIFSQVEASFRTSHPCITGITFSYGSSATLATQIVNGAPADVFVSASAATMATVENTNVLIDAPITFAKNFAEIMVYPKSKFASRITELQDLSDTNNPGITVGLCVASAPCGALANAVLATSSLSRQAIADSESPAVEDVVLKVELGELDAGIVYHSDCFISVGAKKSLCVAIPAAVNSTNSYLAVALNTNTHARSFVSYLRESEFQKIAQSQYGFLAP